MASLHQSQLHQSPGTRILVVDDDRATRRLFVMTLEMAGYECVEAGSGAEALERIDATIAAVVLDNRLPDGLGVDLLHKLRGRLGVTMLPVLLVTGDEELTNSVAGLSAGATDYLLKPVEPDELVARVSAHLRGQAAWFAFLDDQLRQRARVVNSLFAIAPRASAEETAAEQFYGEMLGHGFVLTPDLAGCLSTPMTELEVDRLVDAGDRVFALLEGRGLLA